MKKLWPTLLAMALTAAVAVGICTFLQATRPVVPDGLQVRVGMVMEFHGSVEEDRTEAVDRETLSDCLTLLRCKKHPFSRKVGKAPTDCYEVMFNMGEPSLCVLYLDWNGEGYFYDVSTTSSYALVEGQGTALRELIGGMLAD